jgi:hypothetical protein
MLRAFVLLLLLANLAFLAWTQGWITWLVGIDPLGQRDPGRVSAQVQPELIRPLGGPAGAVAGAGAVPARTGAGPNAVGSGASAAETVASAPAAAASGSDPAASAIVTAAVSAVPACLEAGPFSAAEMPEMRTMLRAALPTGSWRTERRERPGVWLIYLGKYGTREAALARLEELQRANVRAEELRSSPDLQPGLSLGRFEDENEARTQQRELARQGVRGARVISITPPRTMTTVRIERADADLRAQAEGLVPQMRGRPFGTCVAAPGAG